MLLALAFGAVGVGGAGAVPDPCQVQVVIYSDVAGVAVTSSGGGTGTAAGYVSFQHPPSTTAGVNLTAQTNNGWPVWITPSTATLLTENRLDFLVTFKAPVAAPAGDAGQITVDARVRINNFACTSPEPARATIRVGLYVDDFGARIVNPEAPRSDFDISRAFDIEVHVRSNAPMRIRFSYHGPDGWMVQGPGTLEIRAGLDLVMTEAVHVVVSGGRLPPGFTTIDITVEGETGPYTADNTPYEGHLGYVVYMHEPESLPIPTASPPVAAAAAAVLAVFVVRRGQGRRREAVLRLRARVAQAKAEGRLAPPAHPGSRP